jgi:hypothetical protein
VLFASILAARLAAFAANLIALQAHGSEQLEARFGAASAHHL